MKRWFNRSKAHFNDKKYLNTFLFSLFLLVISLVINFYAGVYATERASNPVTDIILDHIRVYDIGFIFVYGAMIFWLFTISILVYDPKKIPFTVKSISLFTITRAIFISLTHIGPFPTQAVIDAGRIMQKFIFGGDLFFSGHTGLPFLLALIFWKDKRSRIFFLSASILFAFVVLMGHLHYSIDVLSAFFITYSIFKIARYLFKKDWKLFES